jgi:sporulation protein YlmC with PRC-barrel domain
MVHKASKVRGVTVRATDGEIGTVHDLYFDDEHWTVRYLVVNTGTWLTGRLVLISPMSMEKTWNTAALPVKLTMDQVRHSPQADAHQPISRVHEALLLEHYGYPYYWGAGGVWGAFGYPAGLMAAPPLPASDSAVPRPRLSPEDRHLRSVADVTGYHIRATDGEIGHVDDFLIDERSWTIRYLVLDTSNWIGGQWVVIAPRVLRAIEWTERAMKVDLTRDAVRSSPKLESIELGPAEDAPPFAII